MYTNNNRLIALVRPWCTSIGTLVCDMRCGSCCWCVGGVGGSSVGGAGGSGADGCGCGNLR